MFASIPSPSSSVLSLGPLNLRFYGLMIAIGAIAGVAVARRMLARKGFDPEIAVDFAMWVVPAGLIGTRIYHVVTDYQRTYCGPPVCQKSVFWDAFKIWQGGLGIPGGIAAGFGVGVWYCRRKKLDLGLMMDVVAPALPLAQAIGRLGNWFNQELFGRPTSLPWGLQIDPANRPAGYERFEAFHPTFLYEALWSLGVMFLLLWIDRKGTLRRGKLFPAYVTMYFLGRMWVEELRIDSAARLGGVRWNFILSIIMVIVGLIWFFRGGYRASPEERELYAAQAAAGPAGPADGSVADQVVGDQSIGEGGPEISGPGAEVGVAEPDDGQVAVGIDPDEGASGAEVSEGSD